MVLNRVLHSLASVFFYVVPVYLVQYAFPHFAQRNDAYIIAILLSLIDLNPYRKSEVTRLVDLVFTEEKRQHLIPYLKNRSLLRFPGVGQKIPDESKFLIYSVFAISCPITDYGRGLQRRNGAI